jgi:Lamin Tail Domain
MLYRIFISVVVFLLSFVFLFVPNLHAQTSDIYISEVQFDGSTAGENDKWIELYNPTTATKNLSGYSLSFKSGKPFSLDGLSIAANSTLLIVNNVNPTTSLLNQNSAFGNSVKTNLLHAFNSSTNPYIHVQLYSGSNLVSSFVKGEGETRGLIGTKTIKKSIEIDQNGSFKLSNSLYSGVNNFGTPGAVIVMQPEQSSVNYSPVLNPIFNTISTNDIGISSMPVTNLQEQIVSQSSVQPVLQTTLSPVTVDVSKLSEIRLSVPNPSTLSGLNKEITFSAIPKLHFYNSPYSAYSQLPLVLVTIASLIKSTFETSSTSKKEVQTV